MTETKVLSNYETGFKTCNSFVGSGGPREIHAGTSEKDERRFFEIVGGRADQCRVQTGQDCSDDHIVMVSGVDSLPGNELRGHFRQRENQPAGHHLVLPIRQG